MIVSPKRLKEMTPDRVAETLADDSRLIIPVGTCVRAHTALPMGSATLIVERLADDLSAEFGVLRAPTVEYGVNPDAPSEAQGYVTLHKKTLHRLLNDILASWEEHGVSEFILLTAHGYDPHEEALATVATVSARVRVVDLFAVNFSDLIPYRRRTEEDRSEVYWALMRHLAPDLVGVTSDAVDASSRQGQLLYERIRTRVSERIFLAPAPSE